MGYKKESLSFIHFLFKEVLVWAHSPQVCPGIISRPSSGTFGNSNETLWKIPAAFVTLRPWQVTVSSSCVSSCALDTTHGSECPVQHGCDKEIGLSSNEDLLRVHQHSFIPANQELLIGSSLYSCELWKEKKWTK